MAGCYVAVFVVVVLFCFSGLNRTFREKEEITAQGEVPRPDIITEAMKHTQKGIYHDCPLKDPTNS